MTTTSLFTEDTPRRIARNGGSFAVSAVGGEETTGLWGSITTSCTFAQPPPGWNGPAVWANFNMPAGGFKGMFNPDTFNPWNPSDPGNRFFDPKAFSDADPQSLGTSPNMFPQVRMLTTFSEDASRVKRFTIREGVALQLRVEMLNLFNRHYFAGPDMNMNNASFGNIVRTAGGSNRTGQFGLRIDW